MAIAQGVLANIAYTAYASGVITSNTEDLAPPTSDPAAQYLRRVSSTLDLKIASFKATEIRPDMQIASFRHGGRSVTGDIAGELSPGTYFDFMEAVHMDTRVAGSTASQSTLTTMEFNAEASTVTFTGGNPITAGFLVGSLFNVTGATEAANDGLNFLITAMGGTTGRVWNIFPAPTNESSASSTFTVTVPGYTTIIPSSGQVSRKYGIEIYDTDVTVSRLFTEVRATKYAVDLPTSGIVKTTITFMGRDMVVGSSEYYTSPSAVTTDDVVSSTSGTVMVGGVQLGIVTALNFDVSRAAAGAPVVGQVFDADILMGTADVTGQMTVYVTNTTLLNDFINESVVSVAATVQSTTAPNSPAIAFYLPSVKYAGASINLTGEAGQIMTMPFQAIKYQGAAVGVSSTTVQVHDTAATSSEL